MERCGRRFATANIGDGNYIVRRVFGDKERAGFDRGSIERMDDEALVGRVLERGGGFLALRGG